MVAPLITPSIRFKLFDEIILSADRPEVLPVTVDLPVPEKIIRERPVSEVDISPPILIFAPPLIAVELRLILSVVNVTLPL